MDDLKFGMQKAVGFFFLKLLQSVLISLAIIEQNAPCQSELGETNGEVCLKDCVFGIFPCFAAREILL